MLEGDNSNDVGREQAIYRNAELAALDNACKAAMSKIEKREEKVDGSDGAEVDKEAEKRMALHLASLQEALARQLHAQSCVV